MVKKSAKVALRRLDRAFMEEYPEAQRGLLCQECKDVNSLVTLDENFQLWKFEEHCNTKKQHMVDDHLRSLFMLPGTTAELFYRASTDILRYTSVASIYLSSFICQMGSNTKGSPTFNSVCQTQHLHRTGGCHIHRQRGPRQGLLVFSDILGANSQDPKYR